MMALRSKFFLLVLIFLGLGGLAEEVQAQRGIGLRFVGDFNYFFRAKEFDVVEGMWSDGAFGLFYQAYFNNGGFRTGLNLCYKNGNGKGFPNFPGVMQDFKDGNNTGLTALEYEIKVGPRFGVVNPQIGYEMGYRFVATGFLEPGTTGKVNRMYVTLPFGCAFDFPTGYGAVGFGVYYDVGLTNVIRNPNPNSTRLYDGSKVRTLSIELTTVFMSGKQFRKAPPPPPPVEEEE
ncbi:MAG: hypothetical protein H6581_01200 [Bacteroidia bacterium]|nr:hypothetical protein [Bacteroidia bacterium]